MKGASLNGELAWAVVAFYVSQNKGFKSISGISYEARLEENEIIYKGGSRNNGEDESIGKNDFLIGFEAIKSLKEINTNSIKEHLPNALYRKRTPFIGLLFSSGIIK